MYVYKHIYIYTYFLHTTDKHAYANRGSLTTSLATSTALVSRKPVAADQTVAQVATHHVFVGFPDLQCGALLQPLICGQNSMTN